MATTILDGDKLDAALLALCAGTPLLRQALDRALFLADMTTYAERGHALTDMGYVRGKAGPAPENLDASLRLLVAQGRLKRTEEHAHGHSMVSYLSIEPYDLGSLAESEIELLATVGGFVRGRREPALSRLLVDETVGSFAIGEEIPYDCAWELLPFEAPVRERRDARDLAFA